MSKEYDLMGKPTYGRLKHDGGVICNDTIFYFILKKIICLLKPGATFNDEVTIKLLKQFSSQKCISSGSEKLHLAVTAYIL